MKKNTKLIIFGIDGGDWRLFNRLIEKGFMPNLKKIKESGTIGLLRSSFPPVTAPAWVSFATGKEPGKTGIFYFLKFKHNLSEFKPITSDDIQGETFYKTLYEAGYRCILVNLPVSYPPQIAETVITGILTQDENNFLAPLSLKREIPELENYRFSPNADYLVSGDYDMYAQSIREIEKNRFKIGKKLFFRDWDFFFYLFSGSDWIQHHKFHELNILSKKIGNHIIGIYNDLDEYLGWFIDNMPQHSNIILMSDHGFETYKASFNINYWLKTHGYLSLEKKNDNLAPNLVNKEIDKARNRRRRIKIPGSILKYLDNPINQYIYEKMKRLIPLDIGYPNIGPNCQKTMAYNPYDAVIGLIYLNTKNDFEDGTVESNQYQKLLKNIMVELQRVEQTIPLETSWEVKPGAEVYRNSDGIKIPDIVLISDNIKCDINPSKRNVFTKQISEGHSMYGMFLAYGSDINRGNIENITICDLAPTILHMFDVPIYKDIDGRVIREIFKKESEYRHRAVKYFESDIAEKKLLKEKIKNLKLTGKL